jgi:hypothetical protein
MLCTHRRRDFVKHKPFSGRHVAIAFALGLAGALAACSGDDNGVSPGGGGSGGSAGLDASRGGSAGLDASTDRDSAGDRGGGAGSTADGSDARGGSGGFDSAIDVRDSASEVRADVTIDQTIDVPADRAPDVVLVVDAREAAVSDAGDAAVVPDVVDAQADTTDVGPASDASDATVSIDASDANTLTFTPAQLPTWNSTGADGGATSTSADASTLIWTAYYQSFGDAVTIEGFFSGPQNWSAYTTLLVTVRALSGAATEEQVELFIEGGADSGFANTTAEVALIEESADGGFQTLTLNFSGQNVSDVERVGIRITAKAADAGVPLTPTVVEIQSISVQ